MIDVLIVHEGTRFANQRVGHMAKVNRFFALSEQSRQAFQALVAIPELEMIFNGFEACVACDVGGQGGNTADLFSAVVDLGKRFIEGRSLDEVFGVVCVGSMENVVSL